MFIAGVTTKPTARSERLWRSSKSPPHPETAARRDPGVTSLGYTVISDLVQLGEKPSNQ